MLTAAITGLISAAGIYTVVTGGGDDASFGDRERIGAAFIAAFMGAVSLMMLMPNPTSGRARWSSAELAGRPAWKLSLGPAQPLPAVAVVLTVLGAGLLWGAVVAALDGAGGAVPLAVVLTLVAVFLLVLAVQMWLTWARPPAFLVSADHLRYDGTGVVVDLAWDDVASVEHADRTSRWACVKVIARVGATSYDARRRRTLLPVDRVPDPAGLELRHALLADVPQALRLLRELHVGERATRESLISRGLPEDSGR